MVKVCCSRARFALRLTLAGSKSSLLWREVDLEFYVWSEPLLCLEQFTGWRQMVLVKEKRKKEKVTFMV